MTPPLIRSGVEASTSNAFVMASMLFSIVAPAPRARTRQDAIPKNVSCVHMKKTRMNVTHIEPAIDMMKGSYSAIIQVLCFPSLSEVGAEQFLSSSPVWLVVAAFFDEDISRSIVVKNNMQCIEMAGRQREHITQTAVPICARISTTMMPTSNPLLFSVPFPLCALTWVVSCSELFVRVSLVLSLAAMVEYPVFSMNIVLVAVNRTWATSWQETTVHGPYPTGMAERGGLNAKEQ